MELKPGYKQTEIGVIPGDWEVTQIQAIASVKTGPFGSTLHERDYVPDGTPIITVEHLGEFGIIHSNLPMVSDYDRQRLKAYYLEENDIVFSRVGSVDRNALVSTSEAGWLFSGRLLRIRPNSERVFSPYLSYHFHYEPFKQRVRSVAVGQTMASLNTQLLSGIDIVLPPLTEQHAIAAVLGDVDALISGLDSLIAKKRAIKQAAMQQLLTGKTRLPGFSGEWQVKKLGEIVQINMGQSPDSENYNHKGIGIPLIQGNADIENRKSIVRVWTTQITKVCDKGDLILTVRAPVGSIGIASEYSCLGRGVCSLKPINYDINFLFHSLVFAESRWKTLEQGSTFTSANSAQIAEFALLVTESIEEQTAIAAVLSDMDAEIAALEQRRDKTRALKQGMMQELLTGKTRLL
jgi:type I restriction enzyme S subunit